MEIIFTFQDYDDDIKLTSCWKIQGPDFPKQDYDDASPR